MVKEGKTKLVSQRIWIQVEIEYAPTQENSGGVMSLWNPSLFEGTIMEANTNIIWITLIHKVIKKKLNTINIYTSNMLVERRRL